MDIGERLKELLTSRGMSLKGLSELSGVSVNTLYAATKKGGAKGMRRSSLTAIADALGVSVDYLKAGTTITSEDLNAEYEHSRTINPQYTAVLTAQEDWRYRVLSQKIDAGTISADEMKEYKAINDTAFFRLQKFLDGLPESEREPLTAEERDILKHLFDRTTPPEPPEE